MINVTLPNGVQKQFNSKITGLEIASSISTSLAKEAVVVEIDDKLIDLAIPIEHDCKLRILTDKDPEALNIIRHDAAHIMAEAIKILFPDTQITIGPTIKDGFYYDLVQDTPFTTSDLQKIEDQMRNIIRRGSRFVREVWKREDAINMFKKMGEFYKIEIIESISDCEEITLYRQGNFIDLCRGPHCFSTSQIKHFKLLKVSGAYWRGNSNNKMLQRIYGTAWATKSELDNYLYRLTEAEKRDHRKIGKTLDLFHFQEEGQGMPFWHHKGWSIYSTLKKYIKNKLSKSNYIEVNTPVMVDKKLWQNSGHWEKFRNNMFVVSSEDKVYALKPMNCPCHIQIFNQGIKSYRDLPIRMSEFGSCYRNEASGGLHGLLRVKSFVQDDAHIFCTEDQVNTETVAFCKLLQEVYHDFGFDQLKVKFSDRPKIRSGDDSVWDKSEAALQEAVSRAGLKYEMNPGEGAFYGPKLEFILTDAMGRDWQCGTLQVDFVLPYKLGAVYITASGCKKTAVMLHRAIIGTFERFIGVLIEEYAGAFPLWLAPIQVGVVGITNDLDNHISKIHDKLMQAGIRSELDISRETVNYKLHHFSSQKVPIIAIIGKREQMNGTVTLKRLGSKVQETILVEQLISIVLNENQKYLN